MKHGSNRRKHGDIVESLDRMYRRIRKDEWCSGGDYCFCYTCGKLFSREQIEVGHFESRRFEAIRWDDRNTRPQCHDCNMAMAGAKGAASAERVRAIYANRLIEEIGEAEYNAMERKRLKRLSPIELAELEDRMKKRLRRT